MSSSLTTELSETPSLADAYQRVRDFSEQIAKPLSAEDCMVQSMPDASPTRWHLAHTTWFFETFILGAQPGHEVFDEQFNFLFNSYYNKVGRQFPRSQRGLISRPGLDRTLQYRRHVDQQMLDLLHSGNLQESLRYPLQVGLNHEQQHQELMFTDIKHALSCNPLFPEYQPSPFAGSGQPFDSWIQFDGGVIEVGHTGDGFAYDNESPRHQTLIQDFSLASHPITCGQFIQFMEDGGYERPDHWLSAGWATVQEHGWRTPLYWEKQDGRWMQFTLAGLAPVNPDWPICHVSYYEADAFARWSDARLPTEFEWEHACHKSSTGQFADQLMTDRHAIHPTGAAQTSDELSQMLGGVWEWTSSSYAAYPGYQPPEGALGEYNGKFMCNQYVLRGGSVATSSDHIRDTYRNFFPADARWQFSGFRLAR
jgi:ergothioneine biosynthesis protein EgtB